MSRPLLSLLVPGLLFVGLPVMSLVPVQSRGVGADPGTPPVVHPSRPSSPVWCLLRWDVPEDSPFVSRGGSNSGVGYTGSRRHSYLPPPVHGVYFVSLLGPCRTDLGVC